MTCCEPTGETLQTPVANLRFLEKFMVPKTALSDTHSSVDPETWQLNDPC